MKLDTAVIVAGGMGTRLAAQYPNLPKAMIPVAGKPLIHHQIEALQREGFRKFYVTVGHLGGALESFLGDTRRFDVQIQIVREPEPLGTAGALFDLRGAIHEHFLVCLGDVVFDADCERLFQFHLDRGALATLVVHPNSHPYDSDVVLAAADGRVSGWLRKNAERSIYYRNIVNSGLYVFSRQVFDHVPCRQRMDLETDLLVPLVSRGAAVFAYQTSEYLRDAGTPDRLKLVRHDVAAGIVGSRNLRHQQKAIFLDRDGTLNVYRGLLCRHEDLELEPDAGAALRRINQSPFLAVVVTNQPVIARNLCSPADLEVIHAKLETLLGKERAYFDALYHCPHHPDSGYPEERADYKIDCDCRKPKPGMLRAAAQRFNIDLAKSWMVGDSDRDIQTGLNLGLRTVRLQRGEALATGSQRVLAHYSCENLAAAVELILGRRV
jgi:mannose-1-phosphate guanylyltransferase / phosphomannomutase